MARLDPNRVAAVTWVGHSTVLLEIGGLRLLTDPVLGQRVGALKRLAEPVAPAATERIDALLVSHLHSDHADLPSLRRFDGDVPAIGPPAVVRWLRGRGFARLVGLAAGQTTTLGKLTIEALPATHDGRRWPRGRPEEAIGFLVSAEQSVYFPGDTDLFEEMTALRGRVDLALMPIWGWGPTLGPGHLDPDRAAKAVALIAPRLVVPIHWGTLAPLWARYSAKQLERPVVRFMAAAARLAPDVEVRRLAPGERVELTPG